MKLLSVLHFRQTVICALILPVLFMLLHTETFAQELHPRTALEKQVRQTLRQSSRRFQLIENKGQEGLPAEVTAYFTTGTQIVFIERDRLRVMVLQRSDDKLNEQGNMRDLRERMSKDPSLQEAYRYNTFEIGFTGSPGFSRVEKAEAWGPVHHFIHASSGSNNITTADGYAEITLRDIYPGTDLRLYSQDNGQLEFDWINWPGADPSRIQMNFKGQRALRIGKKGDLEIQLGMGQFAMHLPESYFVTPAGKQRTTIRFKRNGDTVGFSTGHTNTSAYPLVIDPDLLWGTFFDGALSTFDEYLFGITLNESNQLLYCAGAANLQVSTAYAAALSGAWDSTFNASKDVLLYGLTKNGEIIKFITYFGGTGSEIATGVAVSPSGIYVCGQTTSLNFPYTDGTNNTTLAFDTTYGGNTDGFVAVFNDSLNTLKYASYLGGPGLDQALTIRTRGDSSFYVSLYLEDSISVNDSVHYLVNHADSLFGGSSEAWIGRFKNLNNLEFGTYIGDTLDDIVNDFQVLSDGDVMFTGTTRYIPEVSANVPDLGNKEVLFGRIHVTDTTAVSFSVLEMLGGSKTDQGWGIFSLGDSASVIVGQTNSTNFPIGAGGVFQSTSKGSYDAFVAKINNDGSGNYKATYTGGSDDDILVSVRPILVLGQPVLLCFGTTQSNDLPVRNYNAGSFYSDFNSGNLDMMFLICDQDLSFKYYLSYIGGSENDYLGQTGAPIGSNHVYFNEGDSVVYVGTTTHSNQTTHAPTFVGRGPADVDNIGVPVFDKTKNNSNNDTHVIIAISTKTLQILPLEWLSMDVTMNDGCKPVLSWQTASEKNISSFVIQRSEDGRNFRDAGQLVSGLALYHFTDLNAAPGRSVYYYRVKAVSPDGHVSYSGVRSVRNCNAAGTSLSVYPTITRQLVTISGIKPGNGDPLQACLYDAAGKRVGQWSVPVQQSMYQLNLKRSVQAGVYILVLQENGKQQPLLSSRIVVAQ